jgi:acyl-CoA synthetase (AMP-forming)/AMP-acid ligase II
VALILHTSGTTSRPKIVPLLQSNVAASAKQHRHLAGADAEDRCLNVMPLFHIHGLLAAVSSSLRRAGQVWCAPGFDALKFFGWLRDADPTWYTAVPTMHQAILSRAGATPRSSPMRAALPALLLGLAARRR